MKESLILKYQEDLEKKYYIFVDTVTLRNTIEELKIYHGFNHVIEYEKSLDLVAQRLMSIFIKYKYKYT